ncbi:AAA family ATPase [Caldimonas caldifontis]|uniref:ATPase n=1 Tax=Caldimonas caldifontis TaxID=1452508 RepID=A0A2S5SQX5_9BURK|nr:AAA family ATPase [Caldimonas caldifontis]PPE65123.1 ATPase [Caldimonas caldifontis]
MSALAPTPARLRPWIDGLEVGLLERSAAVRLALLAALAGEHVLLIGPPGTAKSELARRLHHAFADARYFERLLTRFSVPEELFGPLSLAALEDDRYERLTDGYLPTAGVAFLDEVFKANSAILNALLTLLNEREFDNGAQRLPVPLICVVGATNEVPQEEGLRAFHDRFLVRVPVAPVSDAQFKSLLTLSAPPPTRTLIAAKPLRRDELDALREAATAVALPEPVLQALQTARRFAAEQGLHVSDRRWRQTVGLLRVQAASEGRTAVDAADLWLLPYVLPERPEQVGGWQTWVIDTLMACPTTQRPGLQRAVEAFERQLDIETSTRQDDGEAGKLVLARSIARGDDDGAREGGITRLVAERLEERLRQHYSPVHIAARVAQVDELLQRLNDELQHLERARMQAQALLQDRLWWPPALRQTVLQRHEDACAQMAAWRARAQCVRDGFAQLPVDETLAGTPPAPIALEA